MYAVIRDRQTAELQQLMMEYTPKPPFDAGEPETAGPDVVAIADKILEPSHQKACCVPTS